MVSVTDLNSRIDTRCSQMLMRGHTDRHTNAQKTGSLYPGMPEVGKANTT